MARNRVYVLFSALAVALLMSLLFFRQFLLDALILPLATFVWLILRVFVLSIPQQVYWWVLIALAVGVVLGRLPRQAAPNTPSGEPDTNSSLDRIGYWRNTLRVGATDGARRGDVQRELGDLLVEAYSTEQQVGAGRGIGQSPKASEIDIPAPVYAFLFAGAATCSQPAHPENLAPYGKRLLQSTGRALKRWRQRLAGRADGEYYRTIEDTIAVIENSLGIKDDYGLGNTDHH